MNKESYSFATLENDSCVYAFESIGKQGAIRKMVYFQEFSPRIYNLALGDYTGNHDNPLDDMKVSDNGDMPKVLATVAKIIAWFLDKNPDASIFIEGNTPTKKVLYHRIIANNIQDLAPFFVILGVDEGGNVSRFDTNIPHQAIVIKLQKQIDI
jgi:hypothetical protein